MFKALLTLVAISVCFAGIQADAYEVKDPVMEQLRNLVYQIDGETHRLCENQKTEEDLNVCLGGLREVVNANCHRNPESPKVMDDMENKIFNACLLGVAVRHNHMHDI